MKRHFTTAIAIGMCTLAGFNASAQVKPNNSTLQPPPANVKVDGELKDWGDSLRYYNEEKKLNYTLANDKDNLYMAIRVNDRLEQARILGAGLTLSINTKGSKKATYSLTFPVAQPGLDGKPAIAMQPPHAQAADKVTQEDRDQLLRARLTTLRNIKVSGFPDIEGDMITTTNTYGIRVAINYDADGYLVYEAAIPLKFFGQYKADKDEWAFNFKINALPKPGERGEGKTGANMGGGGMGGGGGMRGGGGMSGGGGRRGGGGGGGMRGAAPGTDMPSIFH